MNSFQLDCCSSDPGRNGRPEPRETRIRARAFRLSVKMAQVYPSNWPGDKRSSRVPRIATGVEARVRHPTLSPEVTVRDTSSVQIHVPRCGNSWTNLDEGQRQDTIRGEAAGIDCHREKYRRSCPALVQPPQQSTIHHESPALHRQ
jgi:hypothetical protein